MGRYGEVALEAGLGHSEDALEGIKRGSYDNMEKPHETLDTLQQIRSKLDEARMLSQSLGTPEVPYDLEVTLDTIIMGIDAQLGALESTGEPDSA